MIFVLGWHDLKNLLIDDFMFYLGNRQTKLVFGWAQIALNWPKHKRTPCFLVNHNALGHKFNREREIEIKTKGLLPCPTPTLTYQQLTEGWTVKGGVWWMKSQE